MLRHTWVSQSTSTGVFRSYNLITLASNVAAKSVLARITTIYNIIIGLASTDSAATMYIASC